YMYRNFLDVLVEPNLIVFGRTFNPFSFPLNMVNLFRKLRKNRLLEINIWNKIKVALLENYFFKLKQDLVKLESKAKLYVSFCDSYLEENLAAQYFNQQGYSTATLQHGQYRVNNRGFEGTDSESYLNFVSTYLFAWGIKTKHEFRKVGIEGSRIIVTGALKPFTDSTKIAESKKVNSFVVFLNGESHIHSNKGLLLWANKFAEKFGFTYTIKPHPMSRLDYYLRLTNNEFMGFVYEECDVFHNRFALVHSSAVILELMVKKFPYFQLNDEYLDSIFKNNYNNFANFEELISLYQTLIPNEAEMVEKISKDYCLFNEARDLSAAKEAYKSAIKSIVNIN
ncbi:hypothetical protein N9O59_05315, partial [Schleiferiaceae bacterium]|nr:hypothetical protein [Schleiferiaceae bacterium]